MFRALLLIAALCVTAPVAADNTFVYSCRHEVAKPNSQLVKVSQSDVTLINQGRFKVGKYESPMLVYAEANTDMAGNVYQITPIAGVGLVFTVLDVKSNMVHTWFNCKTVGSY